jgi:hypothetical protein
VERLRVSRRRVRGRRRPRRRARFSRRLLLFSFSFAAVRLAVRLVASSLSRLSWGVLPDRERATTGAIRADARFLRVFAFAFAFV